MNFKLNLNNTNLTLGFDINGDDLVSMIKSTNLYITELNVFNNSSVTLKLEGNVDALIDKINLGSTDFKLITGSYFNRLKINDIIGDNSSSLIVATKYVDTMSSTLELPYYVDSTKPSIDLSNLTKDMFEYLIIDNFTINKDNMDMLRTDMGGHYVTTDLGMSLVDFKKLKLNNVIIKDFTSEIDAIQTIENLYDTIFSTVTTSKLLIGEIKIDGTNLGDTDAFRLVDAIMGTSEVNIPHDDLYISRDISIEFKNCKNVNLANLGFKRYVKDTNIEYDTDDRLHDSRMMSYIVNELTIIDSEVESKYYNYRGYSNDVTVFTDIPKGVTIMGSTGAVDMILGVVSKINLDDNNGGFNISKISGNNGINTTIRLVDGVISERGILSELDSVRLSEVEKLDDASYADNYKKYLSDDNYYLDWYIDATVAKLEAHININKDTGNTYLLMDTDDLTQGLVDKFIGDIGNINELSYIDLANSRYVTGSYKDLGNGSKNMYIDIKYRYLKDSKGDVYLDTFGMFEPIYIKGTKLDGLDYNMVINNDNSLSLDNITVESNVGNELLHLFGDYTIDKGVTNILDTVYIILDNDDSTGLELKGSLFNDVGVTISNYLTNEGTLNGITLRSTNDKLIFTGTSTSGDTGDESIRVDVELNNNWANIVKQLNYGYGVHERNTTIYEVIGTHLGNNYTKANTVKSLYTDEIANVNVNYQTNSILDDNVNNVLIKRFCVERSLFKDWDSSDWRSYVGRTNYGRGLSSDIVDTVLRSTLDVGYNSVDDSYLFNYITDKNNNLMDIKYTNFMEFGDFVHDTLGDDFEDNFWCGDHACDINVDLEYGDSIAKIDFWGDTKVLDNLNMSWVEHSNNRFLPIQLYLKGSLIKNLQVSLGDGYDPILGMTFVLESANGDVTKDILQLSKGEFKFNDIDWVYKLDLSEINYMFNQ